MSSVKELAKEVFEGRQAIAETIKVNPIMREVAAKYVKQLLNIFKVSNEQKETAIWIWQLQLTLDESSENLFISFAIEKGGNALFFNRSFLEMDVSFDGIIKGKNDELSKAIYEIQIPKSIFHSLCDYCKENLTEYFNVKIEKDKLILELKDTIC